MAVLLCRESVLCVRAEQAAANEATERVPTLKWKSAANKYKIECRRKIAMKERQFSCLEDKNW